MPLDADLGRDPAEAAADDAPGAASRWDTDLLSDEVVAIALDAGCAVAGIASAEVFEETRIELLERKARGLHGGMQFTYRNPDRSTDPDRILAGARSLVVGAWGYRRSEAASCGSDDGIRDGSADSRAGGDVPRPDRPAGWPSTRVGTTTTRCGPLSPRWPTTSRSVGGGPRWSATTTPSSTGPPPTGPASAGSARTA